MPDEIPKVLEPLTQFLEQLPSIDWVNGGISTENGEDWWWVKFQIDINHRCSWFVVQQLAHVVNQLSTEMRIPAILFPVSPPVYLNGGPSEFLSWVIEVTVPPLEPSEIIRQSEPYFPSDLSDAQQWIALAESAESAETNDCEEE